MNRFINIKKQISAQVAKKKKEKNKIKVKKAIIIKQKYRNKI